MIYAGKSVTCRTNTTPRATHCPDFTPAAADDLMGSRGGALSQISSNLPTPLANKRMNIMNDATIEIEELPTFEVSDEALEAAAGSEKAGYTLAYCSGLSVCPA